MKYFSSIILLFIIIACGLKSEQSKLPDLSKLQNNQALIDVDINGKDFYGGVNIFDSKINFAPNNFRINLLNKENGNVIINLDKENWVNIKPKKFIKKGMNEYSETGQLELLIGKLINNGSAEGYFFSNGIVEFTDLKNDLIGIKINGNLIKPGDAEISENFKLINGNIYIKKPTIHTDDLDLKTLVN